MYENYREIPSPLQTLWDVLDDNAATAPSVLRMVPRATAFVLVTLVLVGPYAFCGLFGPKAKRPIARLWFKTSVFICGLKVDVLGTPSQDVATIMASNHVSYLDIIVLGMLTDARFVAKSDVALWPLFGFLSKLACTVFVTRDKRCAARDCGKISTLVAEGERLILFPEGTSSNGRSVLPFRTSLFAAVDPARAAPDASVQPVTVAYTMFADGRPLTGHLTDLYAWYGDMTMFGHLIRVFGMKGANVEVTFHAPLKPVAFPDRKTLAAAAELSVRNGLNEPLSR